MVTQEISLTRVSDADAHNHTTRTMGEGGNLALGLYFVFWYVGNSFYNIQNKLALNATGGKHAGFGMTVATLQLGVGTIYSFLIWIVGYNFLPCCGFVAPTKQGPPKLSMSDFFKMLPVAFCSAAAHSASVLALNAGSVSFGQIVKAGEPVFSALVNTIMYGKSPSAAKWLCLPIIIGGVVFSTLKPDATGKYTIEFGPCQSHTHARGSHARAAPGERCAFRAPADAAARRAQTLPHSRWRRWPTCSRRSRGRRTRS